MSSHDAKKARALLIVTIFILSGSLYYLLTPAPAADTGDVPADFTEPSIPHFIAASVSPDKVIIGDVMTIRVTASDPAGISTIRADMGGIETIYLALVNGTAEQGTWEGFWLVHSTGVREYDTTIVALNSEGRQATTVFSWFDPVAGHWWDADWTYRLLINVTETAGTKLTDYQIPITLDTTTFDYAKADAAGDDLRFTLYNDTTETESEIAYWIGTWNTGGESTLWVNVSEIPASDTASVYLYYGNGDAGAASDKNATFLFWDDFITDTGWTYAENNAVLSGAYQTDEYYSAPQSYEVESAEGATIAVGDYGEIYKDITLPDTDDILISTFNKGYNDGGSSANVYMRLLADSTAVSNVSIPGGTSTVDWTERSGSYSPGSTTVRIHLQLYFNEGGSNWGDRHVWWDDLLIRGYASSEPTTAFGGEDSAELWMDYFGGDAAVSETTNVLINNGKVNLTNTTSDETPFSDSFEGDLSKWNDNGGTSWYLASDRKHDGTWSVKSDSDQEGDLTSDNIDLSDALAATLEFWINKDATDAGDDILLYYYDGGSYNLISDLDTLGGDDVWLHYSASINVGTYGVSNFRIRFNANLENPLFGSEERVWVDQVYVNKTRSVYESSGSVTSVALEPLKLAYWTTFTASHSVPAGTALTYRILNAADDSTVDTITAAEAAAGEDISALGRTYTAVKIKAEFTATDTDYTPEIYGWNISWEHDLVAPSSSVSALNYYWQNSVPFTITASASDPAPSSGVASVALWYRFATDNSSWGSWALFGTDTGSPWSWSFSAPSGDGYYEFYSIAKDAVDNTESAPGTADTIGGYNRLPTVDTCEIRDGSNSSRLNAQIDVNAEYHFHLTITDQDGWDDVAYVDITAWHDAGSDAGAYNDTAGGNLNMHLRYDNSSGTASYSMLWPADGEVTLGAMAETAVSANQHTLDLFFTPNSQIRYAPGDGAWAGGAGHNDANSWNFEVVVTDKGNTTSSEDEYGVYRYSAISPDSDWVGVSSIYPGYATDTNTVTATYSSNYDFNLSVWIDTDLINDTSGHTLAIADNLKILADGDVDDNITSDTTFTGAGAAHRVQIITNYASAPTNGASQTVDVKFNIYVPFGTFAGRYTSPVSLHIEQKP